MRRCLVLAVVLACDSQPSTRPDAPIAPNADASTDAAATGFGSYSGMCGVLGAMELTGTVPSVVRDTLTFERGYMDPIDRPLLTAGGRHLAETPNAGGSSGLSEIFAFEQLAHCEDAELLKTETEIIYDQMGKITDLLVEIEGHKIGVSVTRAVAFPFGAPYTLSDATTLVTRKLDDIQLSTANVSAQDRWTKQFLAVLAWDDQAADTFAQAWSMTSATTKADTIVIITSTAGDDLFIYSNQ